MKGKKEHKKLGVCPKCFKIKRLTRHHLLPQRFFGKTKAIILLCEGCHIYDENSIERLLPQFRKLTREEYFEVTKKWLRGERVRIIDKKRKAKKQMIGTTYWED